MGRNRVLPQHRLFAVVFIIVLASGIVLYGRRVTVNPAGFFIDESSVAYNAWTISQNGHDEYGTAWPLYFRAFGDYKNPIYIYLLAAIFRIAGPGVLVARMFSAILGVCAALTIGLIGYRLTKKPWLGLASMFLSLTTPWLFVLTRTVVEVALYPLVVALFLLALAQVADQVHWNWLSAFWIALTLALLTYTYSVGRLLAPLLAIGLLWFVRPAGLRSLGRVWLLYGISLAPLLIFRWRHPGALAGRFMLVSYLTPETTPFAAVKTFVRHFLQNVNPARILLTGDRSAYQIASTYNTGPILTATFLLAVIGVYLLVRRKRLNFWWAFILYGLVCSFVPASLTRDEFHILRLSPVPVFMVVLTIPALEWLMMSHARRALVSIVLILTCAQATYFQIVYEHHGRDEFRLNMFDADYESRILPTALAASAGGPIHIQDTPAIPGYIQAKWYATLEHLPLEKFVILEPNSAPPPNAIVISTAPTCDGYQLLYERSPYRVYLAR